MNTSDNRDRRYRVPRRLCPLAESADDLSEAVRIMSRDCLGRLKDGEKTADIRQIRELTAAIKDLTACVRSLRHLPEPLDKTNERIGEAKLNKALGEGGQDGGVMKVVFTDGEDYSV